MDKSSNLDFSGTIIYCGLDVHLKSWRVNIRDQEMELRDFTQNTDPVTTHHFLTENYPNATYKVGYEAFRQARMQYSIEVEVTMSSPDFWQCIVVSIPFFSQPVKKRRWKPTAFK